MGDEQHHRKDCARFGCSSHPAVHAPLDGNTVISFELEPPSVEEMVKRMEATLPNYPYLVAVRDDQVAGSAHAEAHRSEVGRAWYDVVLAI